MLASLMLMFLLSSCYEEADWVADNAELSGKKFPTIASFSSTNGASFVANETVNLDIRYWSVDPIESIKVFEVLDDVTTEIFSAPYVEAYSPISQMDSLLVSYPVPTLTECKTITLITRVINKNELSKEKSIDIEVCP